MQSLCWYQETYIEIQTEHLPQLLLRMISALTSHLQTLHLSELRDSLKLCSKILSKVQPPLLSAGTDGVLQLPSRHSSTIKEWEDKKVTEQILSSSRIDVVCVRYYFSGLLLPTFLVKEYCAPARNRSLSSMTGLWLEFLGLKIVAGTGPAIQSDVTYSSRPHISMGENLGMCLFILVLIPTKRPCNMECTECKCGENICRTNHTKTLVVNRIGEPHVL